MFFTTLILSASLAFALVLPIGPEPVGLPIHHTTTHSGKPHAATPSAIRKPLPYELKPIMWTAPAEMGNISFTGTHAEVQAKIAALKPIWQTNATHLARMVARGAEDATMELHLRKRSDRYNQYCSQSQFGFASYNVAVGNYENVYRTYGNGLCGAAPRTCGRFECSWDSALVMCNDGPNYATIPCATLAQNAAFITGYCLNQETYQDVEGQAFYHNPDYNVLVKMTDPGKSC
jgi:hypothetical protein